MNISELEHLREFDEIRFKEETLPNGQTVTIVCYMIANPALWEETNATECRGITFDSNGDCISRSFEKFFNLNENSRTQYSELKQYPILSIMEKKDGSMITPVLVGDTVYFKTKKTFFSDVAKLATEYANSNIQMGKLKAILNAGITPIFEYTDRRSQVVIDYGVTPQLTLLSARWNATGDYLPRNEIDELAYELGVKSIKTFSAKEYNITDLLNKATEDETLKDFEGWVVQFIDNSQVKIKTEWYNRNHSMRTALRERDVADMVINETIDDVKSFAVTEGYDVTVIEEIERRVVSELMDIVNRSKQLSESDPELSIKDFAIKNREHELFGLAISLRKGSDIDPKKYWIGKYRTNYDLLTVYSNFISE